MQSGTWPRASRCLGSLLVAALAGAPGCGLLIDPQADPDSEASLDAGARRDGGSAADAGSVDASAVDASAMDARTPDAGRPMECAGAENGEHCGDVPPRLCMAGQCEPSRCGDGLTDDRRGELCDDGNAVVSDGCEPTTCTPSCMGDGDCAAVPCNIGSCDPAVGLCTYTPTDEGDACGGMSGTVCRSGVCLLESCGDGDPDSGEQCDTGTSNNLPGSGCEPDCTFTCSNAIDCSDGVDCNGIETCVSATRVCAPAPATAVACPARACETASCDPLGCVYGPLDGDGDGEPPLFDMRFGVACGRDCNDGSALIGPDAPELPNAQDDDCDGDVDEAFVRCYPDLDGDGYGGGMGTERPSCLAGELARGRDCYDDPVDPDAFYVNPGQTAFSTSPWCDGGACSFDWDCSGMIDREPRGGTAPVCGTLLTLLLCNTGAGWVGGPPACGDGGTWRQCSRPGPLSLVCRANETSLVQACR